MTYKSSVAGAVLIAVALTSAVPALARDNDGPRRGPDFSELDTNGDGQLTQSEMQAHAAERFSATDTDGDGILSAAEMTARAGEERAERLERRIERMIEARDANGDGGLSLDELSDRRATRFFERADQNDDGVVSEAEFAEAGEKMRRRSGGHGGRNDG